MSTGPSPARQSSAAADHRVAHGQHVHAVDDLGVHAVVGEAGAAQRQRLDAHDLVVGAMGHAVVVVLDEVDDGQPALALAGQEVGPLVLRGEVERLQDHAVGVGAVTREAADDLARAQVAQRHGRAGGDGHAAADDGVGAQLAASRSRRCACRRRVRGSSPRPCRRAPRWCGRRAPPAPPRRSPARSVAPLPGTRAWSCSSLIWRMAEKPLAMASPWPRWELVMRSVGQSTDEAPTAVPSWPIETCVGPR